MPSLFAALAPTMLFVFAAIVSATVVIRSVRQFGCAFTALRQALGEVETTQACRILQRTVEVKRERAVIQPLAAAPRRAAPALPLAA